MAIYLKNNKELGLLRTAGRILAEIVSELEQHVTEGISTGELDQQALDLCKKNNVIPAFTGYNGYPKVLCTGVNDVAVHGIPSYEEVLKNGQIVSLDMGIIYQGFYSDYAVTVPVGKVDNQGIKLIEVTKLALQAAINNAVAGKNIGDLGYVMEQIARLSGFNVIKVMVGHGIGRKLHEEPEIPCFGRRGTGIKLLERMTLAIEAMINEGSSEITFEKDNWTTRTKDGKRSAIFEHTVVVGKEKAEILTEI
ncbi:MAG TPA: type I methionyl aminopeptidase [Candidatus Dojkabacteria bacterium]|nr:type I methionyl aminopeptidase [Candidatus Dojkabacteria bacterium]